MKYFAFIRATDIIIHTVIDYFSIGFILTFTDRNLFQRTLILCDPNFHHMPITDTKTNFLNKRVSIQFTFNKQEGDKILLG